MNIRYLLVVLCVMSALNAMEKEGPKKVDLKELTKSEGISKSSLESIQKWMSGNDKFLRCATDTHQYVYNKAGAFNPEGLLSYPQGNAQTKLASLGFLNKSTSSNFVFSCPGAEEYLLKIAGLINRGMNGVEKYCDQRLHIPRREMTALHGDKVVEYLNHHPLDTKQGISRAFCENRLRKLLESNTLDNNLLETSKTYLVAFPWTEETDPVTDEYYFPVEEVVKGEVLTEETWKLLSPKSVVELLKAAQHGYLWSMKPDNFMKTSDGKIYPIDLEQPNRWFYGDDLENNKKVCQLYAVNGMVEVMRRTKGNQDQHNAVKAYVKDLNMNFFCEEAQSHLKAKPEFQEILGIS